jgi:hypothetical protein
MMIVVDGFLEQQQQQNAMIQQVHKVLSKSRTKKSILFKIHTINIKSYFNKIFKNIFTSSGVG